jgi:two-component system, NtrC family, sensor kinase
VAEPTVSDLEGVLQEVAETAATVCDAAQTVVFLVEGDRLRWKARFGQLAPVSEATARERDVLQPRPIARDSLPGRAILDRAVIHFDDIQALDNSELIGSYARADGARSALSVPMMVGDEVIGAFFLLRDQVHPLSAEHTRAAEYFARFAATAIERARLAAELDQRNRDLAEALDHQTATAEILSIISRSPADVQPILDAVC